jgi:hypothetical protein
VRLRTPGQGSTRRVPAVAAELQSTIYVTSVSSRNPNACRNVRLAPVSQASNGICYAVMGEV